MSAYSIVKTVVITEKSSAAMEGGKYTFKVCSKANKIEIAKAIKTIFGVTPVAVNTMNCTGKARRKRTAAEGKKADYKKAIVTLKAGETINLF